MRLDVPDPIVQVPAKSGGQRIPSHSSGVIRPGSSPDTHILAGNYLLQILLYAIQGRISPRLCQRVLYKEEKIFIKIRGREFIQPGFQKKKILGRQVLRGRFVSDIQRTVTLRGVVLP